MGAEARRFGSTHLRCNPLRDARGEGSVPKSGGSLLVSLPGEAEGLVSVLSAMFFFEFLSSSIRIPLQNSFDEVDQIDQLRLKSACTSDREYQRKRKAPPLNSIE